MNPLLAEKILAKLENLEKEVKSLKASMLPSQNDNDLDRLEEKIVAGNLDPLQALRDAGVFK